MMNVFSLSSASVSDSGPTLRVTPQKMRCRRRARVVLPLDEGPEIPTTRALGVGWIGDMEGECEEEKIEFGHRRSVGRVGRLSYLIAVVMPWVRSIGKRWDRVLGEYV